MDNHCLEVSDACYNLTCRFFETASLSNVREYLVMMLMSEFSRRPTTQCNLLAFKGDVSPYHFFRSRDERLFMALTVTVASCSSGSSFKVDFVLCAIFSGRAYRCKNCCKHSFTFHMYKSTEWMATGTLGRIVF